MAAAMNRSPRSKPMAGPASRAVTFHSLEDLLATPSPLPDEAPEEVAQLRAAILADLAPVSAHERIRAAIWSSWNANSAGCGAGSPRPSAPRWSGVRSTRCAAGRR